MSVHFRYVFDPVGDGPRAPSELQADRPLFAILRAIEEAGSMNLAASRLQLSYRHLWGYLRDQEAHFGAPLVERRRGQRMRLSALSERLLAAERLIHARHQPAIELLAGQFDNELLAAVDPGLQRIRIAASHDLLFGGLRNLARERTRLLLDIDFLGSAPALERLNNGEALVAGMHLPLDTPAICQRGTGIHLQVGRQLRLGEHKLIRMSRREQGLIVAAGNPKQIRGLADLARPEVRFINRQAGAGTRLILDDLLALHGISPAAINGYQHEELTHLAVAVAISAGIGDCGLGLRASAERVGLAFIPLLHDQYFLVCTRATLDSEALLQLRTLLESPAYGELVAGTPGYDPEGAGQIISLRHSLPWYK